MEIAFYSIKTMNLIFFENIQNKIELIDRVIK